MKQLCVLFLVTLSGCGTDSARPAVESWRLEAGVALVLTSTFETSSLDLFRVDKPSYA